MHKSGIEAMNPAPDDLSTLPRAFDEENVGTLERAVSLAAGCVLALTGLRRLSPLRLIAAAFLLQRGATGSCPAYRALNVSANREAINHLQIEESLTINRPVEEIYAMWHELERLPRYMTHLESVTRSDGQSHWVVKTPVGVRLEWDAANTEDEPNRRIVWTSLPGSSITHSGAVYFHPSSKSNATEVKVILSYQPPAGAPGAAAAKLLGYLTEQQIRQDIRGFKAIAETGERANIEGQPAARGWKSPGRNETLH